MSHDECGGDRPRCLQVTGTCGCTSTLECGPLAHCAFAERRCVTDREEGCTKDSDCPTRLCGPEGVCVFCLADFHCDVDETCSAARHDCEPAPPCAEAAAAGAARGSCPEGGRCDVAAGACVACLAEADCGPPAEWDCASGRCVPEGARPCAADADCPPDAMFCSWSSGVCVWVGPPAGPCGECASDAHCAAAEGGAPALRCLQRSDGGRPAERHCARPCAAHADCPQGQSCEPVPGGAQGGEDDGAASQFCVPGATCAASRDLGLPCRQDRECGAGGDGRCWEGRCAHTCDPAGPPSRACAQGFVCERAPADLAPWPGACVPAE